MKNNALESLPMRKKERINRDRKLLPVCYLCNEVPAEGIRSGFFLKGIYICSECERDLINSKPGEKDEYMLTIAKLRYILFNENPRQ